MRTAAGITLLLLQLTWMLREQTKPTRYFCWAPNDYMTSYQIEAARSGVVLSPNEISARYHVDAEGIFEYPPQHIIDILEQRERTASPSDRADVTLHYRLNGHAERSWQRSARH